MGQAKLKRQMNAATARRLFEETAARPEVQAVHAAALADEELQARLAADTPGQAERLTALGWRQVQEGNDGAGWWAHPRRALKLVHSVSRESDGSLWGHFSMSCRDMRRLPGWYDLRDIQWVLYPGLTGIQVVAPPSKHVSIGEVLHIWTCLTADIVPEFGRLNTI